MRLLLVLLLCLALCGCVSMQNINQNCQKNIEQSNQIYERVYESSYNEIFLACLNYFIESNAEVYLKDYTQGIILARNPSNCNWSLPSDNMGIYINKTVLQKTKIILKLSGFATSTMGRPAKPEDTFNAIGKEIEFQRQINGK